MAKQNCAIKFASKRVAAKKEKKITKKIDKKVRSKKQSPKKEKKNGIPTKQDVQYPKMKVISKSKSSKKKTLRIKNVHQGSTDNTTQPQIDAAEGKKAACDEDKL